MGIVFGRAGTGRLNVPKSSLADFADLIEPRTCRIRYIEPMSSVYGKPIRGANVYMLTCGHFYFGAEPPSFCPECGAEVVDEAGD